MENPVGLRFIPTDEEIVDHYLRLKNLGGSTTSHVDQVISTLNICNFDPWELPRQSRMESKDEVWYFFGRKEKRYKRGERQIRKTKSGFWKKTGVTMNIKRKRGNTRDKIGEKRVLVFHSSGSKTNWIMHEYDATTSFSPYQNMTYTICKVQFKGGEAREIPSPVSDIDGRSHALVTHMTNSGGESGAGSEELQNPRQLSGVLDKQQQTEFLEAIDGAFDMLSSCDWKYLIDDDELSKSVSMQTH